jgi:preprotein translocase subunit SecG
MFALILIIHVLVCFALMAVVLMQSGKGHGLASAFGGGGGNQTLFGGRGAVDFLGKATWVLGGAFMVTSLTLAMLAGGQSKSAVQESLIKKEAATAPGAPAGGGEGALPAGTEAGGQGAPAAPAPTAAPPAAAPSGTPPAAPPAGQGK